MKYCSHCGKPLVRRVPPGDRLERHVCDHCDVVHYQNPRIITGTIPEWEDRILLCRRAIEPRYGLWTLPAGFLENDETTQQGAARETLEETNARVKIEHLFAMYNIPHINQVYVIFRGRLDECLYGPTDESLDVRLFEEKEIPWDRLAFPVMHETLKHYFNDRAEGKYQVHLGDIHRRNK